MSKQDRSYTMSQIRSTGTNPEERLERLLRQIFRSAKIQSHVESLPGRPDFVIKEYGLAFFADGCFFHACPEHYVVPESNREYWVAKIERNAQRDKEVDDELEELGYNPVRIWEHELKGDSHDAVEKIRAVARSVGFLN